MYAAYLPDQGYAHLASMEIVSSLPTYFLAILRNSLIFNPQRSQLDSVVLRQSKVRMSEVSQSKFVLSETSMGLDNRMPLSRSRDFSSNQSSTFIQSKSIIRIISQSNTLLFTRRLPRFPDFAEAIRDVNAVM
mmetsp:Transcript_6645/g.11868  ORF Transcript_6645/g.11868 Transcript_6645/m.11868 type:complete len:133 (-) Transcript_6645:496-894(-)